MTLRHSPRSVETTVIALAIAAGFTFVAAFASQVDVVYFCLPTGIMLVSATALGPILDILTARRFGSILTSCYKQTLSYFTAKRFECPRVLFAMKWTFALSHRRDWIAKSFV